MSQKMRFRPTVQILENRRCMAAAIGDVAATPEEPAREIVTIDPATIDGYSASEFAGGLAEDTAQKVETADEVAQKVQKEIADGSSNTFFIGEIQARPNSTDVDAVFNQSGAADDSTNADLWLEVFTCPDDGANDDMIAGGYEIHGYINTDHSTD